MHSTPGPDEAAIRDAWSAQREAMVRADTAALDVLLDDSFTLTHMTGYVQPKREWLEAIDAGEMRYHAMEDVSVTVDAEGSERVLTTRTRTDATIWGSRSTWPLRLRLTFTPDGDGWTALRSVASTW